ncbi:ADL038Wp [Eremothecium gossypii ATCC 10895]|uniref:ADL038Wp n=1 Tax=Eremothecium gossypii (strain ATCC 10895 / CBS 109.51 / FGSC 9923 / NRRL Y-1056) TaxID=284811 RepID=Q75AF6_EREGS|nr:ADL038Wp [Eremothecium gossypii ATCC 10895]AAS51882.2 ADL038Wp [Eremothecium gossypii ATCC 10895]AEY96180.1 FADL038Wp [Eremothecium gossypii FDAG1]
MAESLTSSQPPTLVKCKDVVRALCDFVPLKKQHLPLKAGDVVYVLSRHESGWCDGIIIEQTAKGNSTVTQCQRGWFPRTYTRSIRERRCTQSSSAGAAGVAHNFVSRPHMMLRNPSTPTLRRNSLNIRVSHLGGNTSNHGGTNLARAVTGQSDTHFSPHMFTTTSSPGSSQTHLKQDYKLDMRRRSVCSQRRASMASSHNTRSPSKSPFTELLPVDPLQRLPIDETPNTEPSQTKNSPAPAQKSNSYRAQLLSVAEVQMFFNSLGSIRYVPVWSPVGTEDGEVLFYNKEHNIYCRTLPLLQEPRMDCQSIFPKDDHLIDLSLRKPHEIKNATSNITAEGQYPTALNCPNTDSGEICVRDLSREATDGPDAQSRAATRTQKCELETTMEKVPVLFSKQELFFHHTSDMRTWTELRDCTLYYLYLSHDSFFRRNQLQFKRNFDHLARLTTMWQLACRLLRNEVTKKNMHKEIRKLVKGLTKSLSKISLASTIYVSTDCRQPGTSSAERRSTAADDISFIRDMKASVTSRSTTLNEVDLSPTIDNSERDPPTESSVRNEDMIPDIPESTIEIDQGGATTVLPAIPSRLINRTEPERGSAALSPTVKTGATYDKSPNFLDETSILSIEMLFHVIDHEVDQYKGKIAKLYHLLKSELLTEDVIPQLYPRMLKNSFDGGAWTNPFHPQMFPLSSSGDINFTSNSGSLSVGKAGSSGTESARLDARNFSNTSSKTVTSIFNRNKSRTFSRSKLSKKTRYPLNEDTLRLIKGKVTHLTDKLEEYDSYVLNLAKSKHRDLEMAASTYEIIAIISQLIDMLESLDLTFFVNLRNLPTLETAANLDKESMELRDHCVATVTVLMMEFFEVKQALHDIAIGVIIEVQGLTLRDPFVFSPMRDDLGEAGEYDFKKHSFIKQDRFAAALARSLVQQDVECNNVNFPVSDPVSMEAASKLVQMVETGYQLTEQLVSERENILNYAARLMKNDLIAELMKGEHDRWFEEDDTNRSVGVEGGIADSHDIQKKKIDLPWYLDSQYESQLVYDANGNIRGGTKEALIEHLTSHLVIDASFNVTMLITFKSMFTTTELLSALILRYNLYPPEGLSYEEYNEWVQKKHLPIKANVINIMKLWFSQYWSPAYYDPCLEELVAFAQLASAEKIPDSDPLIDLIKKVVAQKNDMQGFIPRRIPFMVENSVFFQAGSSSYVPSPPLPPNHSLTTNASSASLGTSFRLKKLKQVDIEASVFAKQLTIKENLLYCKIHLFECLDRTWKTRYCDFGGSPNISNFIQNSNHLTNYVSYMIVKQTDLKRRVQIVQYFIDVAETCRALNNFSSMTAITSAMLSSSIYRLKRTWAMVHDNYKESLDRMNALMDSAKNFRKYRELLESLGDCPCVPFFGVYLSDLTFTAGGNPDYLKGTTGVINFAKRARIVNVLKEIDSYQRISYRLKRIAEIQEFIDERLLNVPNIEKQYELSLRIEPRQEVSTGLNADASYAKHGSAAMKGKKLGFVNRIKRSHGSAS